MIKAKVRVGGPIDNARLEQFVHRVERLEEERKAIGGDIKDVYSEAKGVGYDTKTMRKVIALRAMDAADRAEQETLLETYLHALGMIDRVEARVAAGESIRKASEAEGMPKSTAIRQVTQNRRNVKNGSGEIETGGQDVASQGGESRPAPTAPLPLPSPEREARPGSSLPSSAPVAASGKEDARQEEEIWREGGEVVWECPMVRLDCGGRPVEMDPPLDRPLIACMHSECRYAVRAQSDDDTTTARFAEAGIAEGIGQNTNNDGLLTHDSASEEITPSERPALQEVGAGDPWVCPMRGKVLTCGGHEMNVKPRLDRPLINCMVMDCPHMARAQEVGASDPRPKGTPTRAENAHVEIDLAFPAHLNQRKRQVHA